MKGPRFDVERLRSALLHLCILCALSMLSASMCIAKDGRLSDVWGAGWTPALSLGFGVQFQEISGRSAASFADFSQQGEANDILTGDFRGRIELAAPPFYEEGFSPRVFVHAGFNAPFSDEFLSERTNNSFSSTDPAFAANCSVTPPNPAILSCDTKARNSVTPNLYWHAGVGIEITLPIDQRQFRIRPSLDYVGQVVESEGRVERSLRGASNIDLGGSSVSAQSQDKVIHGFGPRLQIDVEVAQINEFSVSLFVEAGLFWMLSDRKFDYSETNGAGDTGSFEVEMDEFAPQGGFGIRIAWTGKK